jgi:hypothetical protein
MHVRHLAVRSGVAPPPCKHKHERCERKEAQRSEEAELFGDGSRMGRPVQLDMNA